MLKDLNLIVFKPLKAALIYKRINCFISYN